MLTFPEPRVEPPDEHPPCLCDLRAMSRHLYSVAERYAEEYGIESLMTVDVEYQAIREVMMLAYEFKQQDCCDA